MVRMWFIIALGWVVLRLPFAPVLNGQELSGIEQLIERYDLAGSAGEYEELVATLLHLTQHPLRINQAPFDSLKLLVFLSDSQIDNLLAFRKTYGGIRHPNELLLVSGIGPDELEAMRPFILFDTLPEAARKQRTRPVVRQELISRTATVFPRQAGYTWYNRDAFLKESEYEKHRQSRFLGPPWGFLVKYRLNRGEQLQAGLTLENDAGEPFFGRYQRAGFDFVSAHLALNNIPGIKQIIIGDYKIQWGQGLVAWHGFSSGKSAATLSSEKAAKGSTPYTSSDENRFLRGISITLQPAGRISTTLFFSRKKTGGDISERDTLDPEDMESASLYQSGYHRSLNERAKKRQVRELSTGAGIQYNHPAFRIGIHLIHYHFTPSIARGSQPYQQHNDTGNRRVLAGIEYKTGYRRLHLYGETALSDNGTFATVNGLRYSLRIASFGLVYRNYSARYTSWYAGSFGEYANSSNEEGLYLGTEFTPLPALQVNGYVDLFRFFAPRYRATLPGNGFETLWEIRYNPGKHQLNARYKREDKPEDITINGNKESTSRIKQELRLQYTWKWSNVLEWRLRADRSLYKKGETRERGYMGYAEVVRSFRRPEIKMQFRLAFFDIDSYNARIYAYEHNVLYGYSFPAYYDKGVRSYLNLNWKPTRAATLYLKAGWLLYPDRESISSGLTKIDNNRRFDLTAQVRIKW